MFKESSKTIGSFREERNDALVPKLQITETISLVLIVGSWGKARIMMAACLVNCELFRHWNGILLNCVLLSLYIIHDRCNLMVKKPAAMNAFSRMSRSFDSKKIGGMRQGRFISSRTWCRTDEMCKFSYNSLTWDEKGNCPNIHIRNHDTCGTDSVKNLQALNN